MTQDRPYAAAGMILGYALVVTYLDNYVRVIAAEAGLWQFHAVRAAMALPVIGLAAWLLGQPIWPQHWRPVVLRSLLHGLAMLIYFGSLGFLPVAQVAAGLFMAPIFVLLLGRMVWGRPIGIWQALAVALGFAGVLLVLGGEAFAGASVAAGLPVLAGLFYALGNIATREWCKAESALTLLAGFFAALGLFGLIGMGWLWLAPMVAPAGPEGFIARGPVWPSGTFLFWTAAQALGSILGVALMIRAYQITGTARVSVYEYVLLPVSAGWSWLIWGEVVPGLAALGMALITLAGVLIALAAQSERSALD